MPGIDGMPATWTAFAAGAGAVGFSVAAALHPPPALCLSSAPSDMKSSLPSIDSGVKVCSASDR